MPIQIAGKINPIQINPLEYKPTVVTPKEVDYSLLQNSLNKIEERRNNYSKADIALNTALGKIKEQMHNDNETASWFENYKNNVKSDIEKAASIGDMDEARYRAERWASDAANNPQISNRIKANANYEQEDKIQQERLSRHEISDATYRWWKAKNPFKYSDSYDSNGNLTGAFNEMDYNAPVADIDWRKIVEEAFQGVSVNRSGVSNSTEKQWSTTTETPVDNTGQNVKRQDLNDKLANGNIVGSTTTASGGSTMSSHSKQREWVTEKSIMDNVFNRIYSDKDLYQAVYQDMEVAYWEYQEKEKEFDDLEKQSQLEALTGGDKDHYDTLKSQIDDMRKYFSKNGSKDINKYIANKASDFALKRSYNNISIDNRSGSSTSSQFGFSGGGGLSGSPRAGNQKNSGQYTITHEDGSQENVTVTGEQVEGNSSGNVKSGITGAADEISTILGYYYNNGRVVGDQRN